MRDTPFSGCPNAVDLRDYMRGSSVQSASISPRLEAIKDHVLRCIHCASAMEFLTASSISLPGSIGGELIGTFDELLQAQRKNMAIYLDAPPKTAPGQIWTTTYYGPVAAPIWEEYASALVLVLRVFTRELTGTLVADVAPVTDDPRLAADWSIVFSPNESGVSAPVVAHLDFQFTMAVDHLERCLGGLSNDAHVDLVKALRAYDDSEMVPPLEAGRMGRTDVRRFDEWLAVAEELDSVVANLAVISDEDDDTLGLPTADPGERDMWVSPPMRFLPVSGLRPGGSYGTGSTLRPPLSYEIGSVLRWFSTCVDTDLSKWTEKEGFYINATMIERLLSARTQLSNWRLELPTELGQLPREAFRLIATAEQVLQDCRSKDQLLSGRAARRSGPRQ